MEKGNTKFRAWSITINNPNKSDQYHLKILAEAGFQIFGQMEKGKNGTPHWQGAVRHASQKTFSTMKKLLPRAHIEPCKNWKQLKKYVTKPDTAMGISMDEFIHNPNVGKSLEEVNQDKYWRIRVGNHLKSCEKFGCWETENNKRCDFCDWKEKLIRKHRDGKCDLCQGDKPEYMECFNWRDY